MRTFLCMILLLGWGLAPAHAQTSRSVIWAHPNGAYYWSLFSAIDQGFAREEGIAITDTTTDNPAQAMQMLVTGVVEVISMTPEVAISAIEKGADLAIIGTENAKVGWSLIARPEINSVADLRGKILGVTQLEEASGTMLKLLLEKKGVKPSDYNVVALGGTPNRFAALKGGAVAATLLTPPSDFAAQSDGMRKLGDTFEAFSGAGVAFVTQRRWAAKNSDALERFLRTAARGSAWLYEPANRDKACAILAKLFSSSNADAERNYDLMIGSGIIARDLSVGDAQIQPWLSLRGSSNPVSRFIDASYLQRALGK